MYVDVYIDLKKSQFLLVVRKTNVSIRFRTFLLKNFRTKSFQKCGVKMEVTISRKGKPLEPSRVSLRTCDG
jgi:hypothetical protein